MRLKAVVYFNGLGTFDPNCPTSGIPLVYTRENAYHYKTSHTNGYYMSLGPRVETSEIAAAYLASR